VPQRLDNNMAGVGPGWALRDAAKSQSRMQTFSELGGIRAFVTAELRSFALFTRL
jgi:hypothetical protein